MTNGNINDELNKKSSSPEDTLPILKRDAVDGSNKVHEEVKRSTEGNPELALPVVTNKKEVTQSEALPPLPRFAAAARGSEPEQTDEEIHASMEIDAEPPQMNQEPPELSTLAPRKPKRFKWVLLGILVMLIRFAHA